MAKRRALGVFCLEGNWSSRLTDRSSVRPLLELLESRGCIRFIHRSVATEQELFFYLDKWPTAGYRAFPLGFLAFHGEQGALRLGRRKVPLQKLSERLHGACAGKVLYFGSCYTLDVPVADLRQSWERTGARAMCGYMADVDWLEAAALELVLIDALSRYKRVDAAFRWLHENHPSILDRLEVVSAY